MTLYCATGNAGKLREFQLAAGGGITIQALTTVPAPEETGATFEANAAEKAVYYSRFVPGLLFADDSGLEIAALGGAPGIFSARYAGNEQANIARVLREMEGVNDRRARFTCVLALARSGTLVELFRGEVNGELLHTPRGSDGFGYDPIFFYPPFQCSFAEVAAPEKQAVSHRGKALHSLFKWLRGQETFTS